MAFGSKDTKGIYKFGEDDTKTTFSELLNTGMDSVSDAARVFSGTAAQRAAFLDAAPGSIWQDTNGTKQLWRWLDGSWNLLNISIAEGGTGATTVAGAQDSLRVGLVPISPTTVTKTGTSATANALGQVSLAVCSQVTLQGVFTSDYRSYLVIFNAIKDSATANDAIQIKLANNGTPTTDTNYFTGAVAWNSSDGSFQNLGGNTINHMYFARLYGQGSRVSTEMFIHGAATTEATVFDGKHIGTTLNNYQNIIIGGTHATGTSYDGFQIISPGGATFSGAVQVFGLNR